MSGLTKEYIQTKAKEQKQYNLDYFLAAFYECRKLTGGWPFVAPDDLRKMYNSGWEL